MFVAALPIPGHSGAARLYSSCVYGATHTAHTPLGRPRSVSVHEIPVPSVSLRPLSGPSEAAGQSAVISMNAVFSLSLFQPLRVHSPLLCPPLPGAVVVHGGSACLPMALELSAQHTYPPLLRPVASSFLTAKPLPHYNPSVLVLATTSSPCLVD